MGLQCSRRQAEALRHSPEEKPEFLSFPDSLVFGAATSAYQIEGAAAEGGRKPSIWDDFARTPGKVSRGATGDVACDHYHCFREDVALMKDQLHLRAYRFSISWSRIIPDGEGEVNEEGVKFYSDLIDELMSHGIEPWVTIYHWDLPSALQSDFQGWLGPKDRVVGAFGSYARICFARFGDRVKHWITINEPACIAMNGYSSGDHAPGRKEAASTEPYIAGHNLLLAHAEAVRIYREEFSSQGGGGQIGITLNGAMMQPFDANSAADIQAAERGLDFTLGWFAGPVWFGDYPEILKTGVVGLEGRLPKFTEEESALLKGSSDFFGINTYLTYLVKAQDLQSMLMARASMPDNVVSDWYMTMCGEIKRDPMWERTDLGWDVVPWGFRKLLLHIQERYDSPGGICITENGCACETHASKIKDALDLDGAKGSPKPAALSQRGRQEEPKEEGAEAEEGFLLNDERRVRFFRAHLAELHAALKAGASVRAYFAWSLFDNFEWHDGYEKRFGIVRVDYSTQRRLLKASARFFADVIARKGLRRPTKREEHGGIPF